MGVIRNSKYRLNEGNQESNYNLARAYHQLGLVHKSVPYYEKVLLAKPHPDPNKNLTREAAYNLHLIYKNSGNLQLARKMLRDYCTI